MLWIYIGAVGLTLGCLSSWINANPLEGTSVILLGPGAGSSGESQVLSLPDLAEIPNNIPTYPVDWANGPVAEIIDEKVMVCGGMEPINARVCSDKCYTLTDGSKWIPGPSMMKKRCYAAAIKTEDGWLVTGGSNDTSSEILIDGKWEDGPELPLPLFTHCLLKLDTRQHLLVGGMKEMTETRDNTFGGTYLLQDGRYVQVEPSNTGPTHVADPACAMLGQEAYVVGGADASTREALSSVYIWSHDEWKEGPELPIGIYGASLVAYNDQLYLLGGRTTRPDHYNKLTYKLEQGEWKEARSHYKDDIGNGTGEIWRWNFPAFIVSKQMIY